MNQQLIETNKKATLNDNIALDDSTRSTMMLRILKTPNTNIPHGLLTLKNYQILGTF
jgi:hypothetical protein